ncbi:hypothetical protein [Mesorhizobium tianshanense]|uniref:hypothetical protein n=1 Tax=Mesorhizobium tianshanense TaxID=39844 RepID=UPI0011A54C4A|nr:hypothetical protein [Mesorhizobium tianshanense]
MRPLSIRLVALDGYARGVVEDFQSNDERRPVSALRNFYAGELLLGKQCLLNAAPNVDPMEILASKFAPVLKQRGRYRL